MTERDREMEREERRDHFDIYVSSLPHRFKERFAREVRGRGELNIHLCLALGQEAGMVLVELQFLFLSPQTVEVKTLAAF